jgi:hypothetical protein
MADLASGAIVRKDVEVQVPPRAPFVGCGYKYSRHVSVADWRMQAKVDLANRKIVMIQNYL